MKIEKDYEELLKLFNRYKVKYCIIGAYAIAFYAKPRYTKDIDILVEPTIQNGKRIVTALNKFGFRSLDLSERDFSQRGKIIQLGYEPIRVDIITLITGCSFKQIWTSRTQGNYGREKVFFIGLKELIKTKKSSKRKQDKADLELLLSVRK